MRQRRTFRGLSIAVGAVALTCATVTGVVACMVPVFRYALERWPADPYRAVVFHEGELTSEQTASVDALRSLPGSEYGAPPLVVFTADTDEEIPGTLAAAWKRIAADALPRVAVFFPAPFPTNRTVWVGPPADAARVLRQTSPAQAELARRLLAGETAVWLFVESGDAKVDEATHETLVRALRAAERELKLPHQLDPADAQYDQPLEGAVELRIAFSTLRVRPDDPKESLLMAMLTGLVGDDTPRPYAAPVFGRGRALTALTREMINEEAVSGIGEFLVGPCSCQVKAANPGVDLLIPVDWEGMLDGSVMPEVALPPLTVPTPVQPPADAPTAANGEASPDAPAANVAPETGGPASVGGLARNLALAGAIAAVLVAAATMVVLLKQRKAR